MKIFSKTNHKTKEICNTKLQVESNSLQQGFKAMENTLAQT